MANDIQLEELTRGQLLQMASKLTQMAMEVKESEKHIARPSRVGSPKDPAVRRLAAMMMHRMHEIEGMSYDDIGNLLGVSRERAFQLHKDLGGAHDPETKLEEAGLL